MHRDTFVKSLGLASGVFRTEMSRTHHFGACCGRDFARQLGLFKLLVVLKVRWTSRTYRMKRECQQTLMVHVANVAQCVVKRD